MKRLSLLVVLLGVACAQPASADPTIAVSDAWAKPSSGTAAVYATITNSAATPDRLIGAMTPGAASAELRDTLHAGAVVPAIVVPANGSVTLAPGSQYVGLTGLKADLQTNDALLVRMHFERAGWIVAVVRVRAS